MTAAVTQLLVLSSTEFSKETKQLRNYGVFLGKHKRITKINN